MATIVLPEDISVRTVNDFHNQLLKAMSDNEEILVDFSSVRRTDLAVYQVLLACARECREFRKVLKLKGVSPLVKEQMRLCGIIR